MSSLIEIQVDALGIATDDFAGILCVLVALPIKSYLVIRLKVTSKILCLLLVEVLAVLVCKIRDVDSFWLAFGSDGGEECGDDEGEFHLFSTYLI